MSYLLFGKVTTSTSLNYRWSRLIFVLLRSYRRGLFVRKCIWPDLLGWWRRLLIFRKLFRSSCYCLGIKRWSCFISFIGISNRVCKCAIRSPRILTNIGYPYFILTFTSKFVLRLSLSFVLGFAL